MEQMTVKEYKKYAVALIIVAAGINFYFGYIAGKKKKSSEIKEVLGEAMSNTEDREAMLKAISKLPSVLEG